MDLVGLGICIFIIFYYFFYISAPHDNPWRRQWQATPVLLPRKSHGWRSLVGYSPWGHHESVATEQLHFHFSLSRNGEGNGNPLQCSCLENPRDGRAWWAAVYGVTQSQTRLKRLSSSSSSSSMTILILLFKKKIVSYLKIFYLVFIYFWLPWVFIAAWAFSSCSEQGLLSSCSEQASRCSGFLLWSTGSKVRELQ